MKHLPAFAGPLRTAGGLIVLALLAGWLSGCGNAVHADVRAAAPPDTTIDTSAPLPLIPVPVQSERHPGHLEITAATVISVTPGDEAARDAGRYLADLLRQTRGLDLRVKTEPVPAPGSIRLWLDRQAPVAQAEGYALDVDAHGMRITARDSAGLFYGMVSAWQLLTPDGGRGPLSVPAASIRDWPRFAWRGQLLDVARHFQDMDTVKHLIDAMALHKLNVLHLHLTDDQGWRIEIKRYPRLTEIGAWRTPPGAGTQGVPARVGGYYTQDQIRELVAYAAQRHISILPEIDMPGHAQAAVAAYPQEVGVDGVRTRVGVDWGVNPYLFNTDARSLQFIRNVLDEVLALFPSTFIHIGGDEAIKDQWEASPSVRAQMRKLGIKNANAMQGWFNEQLAQYLTAHGRRLIGWDEILEGGLPASASVMSWRGIEGAVTAARQGHDVVLAPTGWMYLDNLQSVRSDEPNGRPWVLTLQRVYEFDPTPAALNAEQARHVLGTQGALWTEYIPSRWHVDHALFPRLSAVAEAAWSPMAARSWDGFLQRLPAQLQRYRALGIDASDAAFAADITLQGGVNQVLDGGPARVVLGNQTGVGQLRYTTDGSTPGLDAPRYTAPFPINLPATVKVAVFSDTGLPLAAVRAQTFDQDSLHSIDTNGLRKCTDGSLGSRVPLLPDLPGANTPVFNLDLFHACWIVPQVRLDGIAGVRVQAARLARNYGLAHEQSKVVQYPAHTRRGELELHLDQCSGPLLARIPLPAGHVLGEQFRLQASIGGIEGTHDLCLRVTAPIAGPLYGVSRVHLLPAATTTPAASASR